MNDRTVDTAVSEVMELIIENGFNGMDRAFSILFNEAMKVERSRALRADPYERTGQRRGYANGYKPKSVKSRLGRLSLQIPQVRGEVEFYPSALEKGERSERALKLAIAEMYIKGISTRKVSAVLEKMCGLEFSSADVSRATQALDQELERWRNRPVNQVEYLTLDARYENVRVDGSVRSCSVLIATGVLANGRRSVLGVSVSLSEAEVHWRQFLLSLKDRGIYGLKLITSDDHPGMKSARKTVFPSVPWQRCQVHIQRNAAAHVSKVNMREQVAADIRDIFHAPNRDEAERLLSKAIAFYSDKASGLAKWMEENIPEGFSFYAMPRKHWRRLRTSNMVERLNREIKRRTRVCSIFPNEASLLRLVTAILAEVAEEWETDKTYLKLKNERCV